MNIADNMLEDLKTAYSNTYLKMFGHKRELPYKMVRPLDQGQYLEIDPKTGYTLIGTDGRNEERLNAHDLNEFLYLVFYQTAQGTAFLKTDSPKSHVEGLRMVRELMGRVSSDWAARAAQTQRENLMKRDGYISEENFG